MFIGVKRNVIVDVFRTTGVIWDFVILFVVAIVVASFMSVVCIETLIFAHPDSAKRKERPLRVEVFTTQNCLPFPDPSKILTYHIVLLLPRIRRPQVQRECHHMAYTATLNLHREIDAYLYY